MSILLYQPHTPKNALPWGTLALIAINFALFVCWEQSQSTWQLQQTFFRFGIVPLEFLLKTDLPPQNPLPFWTSPMTMLFLHAGLLHLLGNMIYLGVFGHRVEAILGTSRFLLFYLLCGLGANVLYILFNPTSLLPSIGASGAICGVMAAYFLSFPKRPVVAINRENSFVLLAAILTGIWVGLELYTLLGIFSFGQSLYGSAFITHTGGLSIGLLLTLLLKPWQPIAQAS